jgi:hypothetical protein
MGAGYKRVYGAPVTNRLECTPAVFTRPPGASVSRGIGGLETMPNSAAPKGNNHTSSRSRLKFGTTRGSGSVNQALHRLPWNLSQILARRCAQDARP